METKALVALVSVQPQRLLLCVIMAENDLLFVHPFIFTGVHLGFFLSFFFLNFKDHPFFFLFNFINGECEDVFKHCIIQYFCIVFRCITQKGQPLWLTKISFALFKMTYNSVLVVD